jgi:hypothetical protein
VRRTEVDKTQQHLKQFVQELGVPHVDLLRVSMRAAIANLAEEVGNLNQFRGNTFRFARSSS